MLKKFFVLTLIFGAIFSVLVNHYKQETQISGAPPYGESLEEVPELNPWSFLNNWTRPDIPVTVGIQVGHWKREEVPDELENLRANTGASWRGIDEVDVNMTIAELIANRLRDQGITVDVLPSTISPRYFADVFIAIHADGNTDLSKSGYKFASPWRDFSGNSQLLAEKLNTRYGERIDMDFDPNITRNMRGYYAFSWWRYEHAVHPMTTSVIAETGFLTNAYDRSIIVDSPELPADVISATIIEYLREKELL